MNEDSTIMIAPEIKDAYAPFKEKIKLYGERNGISIFILQFPLIDRRYDSSYRYGSIILIQGHRLMFVDINNAKDSKEFHDYFEDTIEDIASIADRFEFKNIIGRPRKWKDELTTISNISETTDIEAFLNSNRINDESENQRRLKYILSLFIGSINDARTATIEPPTNPLDSVKHKIQLFDCDQTKFIYGTTPHSKIYKIQGLSGTGKTELLLHKLKEIYVSDNSSRIGFTCFSRVLADSLRKRIPEFFDFMNVQKQIDWEERLLCVKAWGEFSDPKSGIYRYICDFYGIPFYNLKDVGSFDSACKRAIEILSDPATKEDFKYAFQYIFIDECQDFSKSFIDLCALVTEKTVYAAGDIFQSINANSDNEEIVEGDLMLYKCYRTAPKTFMISQALGWGLFEDKKIRWLSDKGWNLCGYTVEVIDERKIKLSRELLIRFDGEIDDNNCFDLKEINDPVDTIINILRELKETNPSLSPDDICIIFLDPEKYVYDLVPAIRFQVEDLFGWECNIAYETKKRINGKFFITNHRNVKGLEFPYVICYTRGLQPNMIHRNLLYTMISRSLLKTFLLVGRKSNGLTAGVRAGIEEIMDKGIMNLTKPTKEALDEMNHRRMTFKQNQSFEEKIKKALIKLDYPLSNTKSVAEFIEKSDNNVESEADIENFVEKLSDLGLISKV